VRVRRDDREMDGKSILGILLLAASQGTELVVSADGIDEADAVDALAELVTSGLGEE
jgi:phosphotransferase system HPr (HPr) family protein